MRRSLRSWLAASVVLVLAAPVLGQSAAPPRTKPKRDREKPAAVEPAAPREAAKPSPDAAKEGERLFGKRSTTSTSGSGWSIMIASFREGDDAPGPGAGLPAKQRAEAALARVKELQLLTGALEPTIEQRGPVTVIAAGRFNDATSREARTALEKVRGIEIEWEGQKGKPFEAAVLVPPEGGAGSIPEYDLRNVKSQKAWARYTLQVAYYGVVDDKTKVTAKDLDEAKAAAEEAVIRLRREGEEAYYFHGPTGSTVTLGLFGESDFERSGNSIDLGSNPTLRTLQRRFPNNLVNGAGVREFVTSIGPDGKAVRSPVMQVSRLVGVP